MRNLTFTKILTVAILFSIGTLLNAQFRFNTNTNIGQTYDLDNETGVANFLVHFNTQKNPSSWTLNEDSGEIEISISKCQTQRGIQVNVYEEGTNELGETTLSAIVNKDFECRAWNQNRNPSRVSSMESLLEILGKFSEKNPAQTDNLIWKPAHCLFDVGEDNSAFGAYPGKFKIVKYGFQLNLEGTAVTEDITFDIDTYDEGNTGKTATYKLIVATGSENGVIGEVEEFYVTGSEKRTVSLAAAIDKDPSVFTNKKVFIKIETEGTGTAIDETKYDPTIVIDNLSVDMNFPLWIDPATGTEAGVIYTNANNAPTGIIDEVTEFSLVLKTANRIGSLKITDDLQDKAVKYITFPEEGAVKANDGEGNYTVDVDYTLTQAVSDGFEWTKALIEIPAPQSGSIDDDIMIFFTATPKASPRTTRFELDHGTRIWYDFVYEGEQGVGIKSASSTNSVAYPNPATNNVTFDVEAGSKVTLFSLSGQVVKVVTANSSSTTIDLNDVNSGLYIYEIENANGQKENGKLIIK